MSKDFILKIIRGFIVGLMFLSLCQMLGTDLRESQQMYFNLGVMVVFCLLIKNIWITLFVWWSIMSFTIFRFQTGQIYLSNIFSGVMLYYLVKVSFKKEHIKFMINGVLWLACLNLFYMILQKCQLDFIFKTVLYQIEGIGGYIEHNDPVGFFGFKACMGILMASCVPLLWTRGSRMGKAASLLMFVPLYLSQASICLVAGIISLLFVLFYENMGFKINRIYISSKLVWSFIVIGLSVGAFYYVAFIDMPMGMMGTRIGLWKIALQDTIIHPVLGWGLDSFRNVTVEKLHIYAMNMTKIPGKEGFHIDKWDNAHNLYIQLFLEWGVMGLIFLGGYVRGLGIKFARSIKYRELIGITGFMITMFIVSVAQFPMWLARCVVYIIPMFAIYEVATDYGE